MSFNFNPASSAQQLADVVPHGLAILNEDLQLVSENTNFKMMVPPLDCEFRVRWLQSIHSYDVARADATLSEYAPCRETLRIEYRTRDQETWCVLTLSRLSDHWRDFGLDEKSGFIVTVADITPEKRAESFQKRLVKDAEERKELQERFIDMISHEIRNPLLAILHCTEDIMEALGASEFDVALLPCIR